MNTLIKRSLGALVAGSAIIGSFALAVPAFAAETVGTKPPLGIHAGGQMPRPVVIGSVTASTVLDQGTLPSSISTDAMPHKQGGIMSSIGGFFSHLFGFF